MCSQVHQLSIHIPRKHSPCTPQTISNSISLRYCAPISYSNSRAFTDRSAIPDGVKFHPLSPPLPLLPLVSAPLYSMVSQCATECGRCLLVCRTGLDPVFHIQLGLFAVGLWGVLSACWRERTSIKKTPLSSVQFSERNTDSTVSDTPAHVDAHAPARSLKGQTSGR